MKNTVLGLLCILVVIAFGCKPNPKASPNSIAGNPYINRGGAAPTDSTATGQQLIGAFDCSSCHFLSAPNTGPSFMQISQRYPNSYGVAQNLAMSITKGSIGAWGNVKAMPAHDNITFYQAVKIAQYILSLRAQAKADSLNGK